MPLRVLIAPDKFKGTLCAASAARAIERGWLKARPRDLLEILPISDGGDGFGQVISSLLKAKARTLTTIDAAHRPCKAAWWLHPQTKTAIFESASVIGLAMLPPKTFHPFKLDTFGLSAAIRAAASAGAEHCLIGIGGSATNDAGFGLARSLGWQFLDASDTPIERWPELSRLARISPPKRRQWFASLRVAVDVQNPLLGRKGATRIYGPQKGLRPADLPLAEACLSRLASVFAKQFGRELSCLPGAGAAGGLGFGLMAFLNAQLESGFDLFARLADLNKCLRSADLVITGEGAIDSSTFMGKATGQIAERCGKLALPCIALAGAANETAQTRKRFTQLRALTELTSFRQAKLRPSFWLERLAFLATSGLKLKGLQSGKAQLTSQP